MAGYERLEQLDELLHGFLGEVAVAGGEVGVEAGQVVGHHVAGVAVHVGEADPESLGDPGQLLGAWRRERALLQADDGRVPRPDPLAQLRKYESEIEDLGSTVSKLRSELSRLERQIAEAEDIDERLTRASNGSERYELHQECERLFDVGSPRTAMSAIRSKMRPLKSSIGDHERQSERIRRDMVKTEQRISHLAAVAARDIDALIIDGNNCCYQGSDFIGLAALIPMTEHLAERYAVTVVFDAAIRSLLGASDDDVRAALPGASVHVVASQTKADETILDAADEPTAWVVSNDRFGEYRDKTPVKEDRLIKHEIMSGRIFVHDLRVNEEDEEGPLSTARPPAEPRTHHKALAFDADCDRQETSAS